LIYTLIKNFFFAGYDHFIRGIVNESRLKNELVNVKTLFHSKIIKGKDLNNKPIEYFFPEKNIKAYKNVYLWPYLNVLSDFNKRLIVETGFAKSTIETIYEKKMCKNYPIIKMDGYVTSIDYGPWDNYYHWYIDSLPRILALHDSFCKKFDKITLITTKNLNEEQLQILKSLLPQNTELQKAEKNAIIKPHRYIFLPFLSAKCSGFLPNKYLNFYKEKINDLFSSTNQKWSLKKIYISRQNAKKRKIINEEQVINFLKTKGFEIFQLEDHSIKTQIKLFKSASLIVAQHGAALTNLLYSENTEIVEIFSCKNNHLNHYKDLALSKDLKYNAIFLDGNSKNDDVFLPIQYLEKIIFDK
jgi:capsular polysaccharide biosynthesis protein